MRLKFIAHWVKQTSVVDQLLNGSWVIGTMHSMEQGESRTIFPYPGNIGGRIVVEQTPVFALQIRAITFSDNNAWMEAPSYRPADLESDNSSWPTVNLTTNGVGELTLAIHDTVDTYRFVVGWGGKIQSILYNSLSLEISLAWSTNMGH